MLRTEEKTANCHIKQLNAAKNLTFEHANTAFSLEFWRQLCINS